MITATTHIKTDNQLVPELRFKEFDEEWNKDKVGNIAKVTAGGTPSTLKTEYWGGDIRWMNSGDLNLKRVYEVKNRITEVGLKNSSTKIIPVNSILIGLAGQGKTRGTAAINLVELCTNQSIAAILPSDNFESEFLYQNIDGRYEELRRLSTGDGGRGGLNLQIIKGFYVPIPSLPEQQKIASFLSAVDKKIQQLTKKKVLLEQYKKGVMLQLFSGQLRFKDENGNPYPDWEDRNLSHYLKVSKTKNEDLKYDKNDVLSVSGEFGIVNQIEFQGRSFAGASVHNYGLVENGDIVYTKSPLKSNPYGIIKVNKDKPGIVSTLYAVYKCKPTLVGAYLDYYFQLDDNTNRYLRPLVQKGSKNDMKINNEKVLIDPIMIPSTIEEQQKVVDYLEELDSKIAIANNQITQTQTFKKGLLQQMFV